VLLRRLRKEGGGGREGVKEGGDIYIYIYIYMYIYIYARAALSSLILLRRLNEGGGKKLGMG